MKKCVKCNRIKDMEEFPKMGNRRGSSCRECYNIYMKEYMKNYSSLHPEKMTAKNKKYYDKLDVYKRRAYRVNGRAKQQRTDGIITSQEWKNLCEKYNHRCLSCGSLTTKLTMDHIIPISKGGKNIIDNIQPLCSTCNSKKHTKTTDYRK